MKATKLSLFSLIMILLLKINNANTGNNSNAETLNNSTNDNNYDQRPLMSDHYVADRYKHDDYLNGNISILLDSLSKISQIINHNGEHYLVNYNQENRNGKRNEINNQRDYILSTVNKWKIMFNELMTQISPILFDQLTAMDITDDCLKTLLKIYLDMKELKSWTFELFDSSGRWLAPGLTVGSITDFGSFDQCLSINIPFKTNKHNLITGQYCMIKYGLRLPKSNENLSLDTKIFNFTNTNIENTIIDKLSIFANFFYEHHGRTAVCIPSSCTKSDLQEIIDKVTNENNIMRQSVSECQTKNEMNGQENGHWSAFEIMIFTGLIVIIAIILVSSLVDIKYDINNDKSNKISKIVDNKLFKSLLCFSIKYNFNELFTLENDWKTAISYKSGNGCESINVRRSIKFESINGVRVVSMFWLIYSHTYLLPMKETFINAKYLLDTLDNVYFQLIFNSWILVDTFFVIAAILLINMQLRSIEKNNRVNLVNLFINRVLRLSPLLWFTLLLSLILPKIASGPLKNEYFKDLNICRNYWWATSLYINNWFPYDRLCLLHTWYLSADMQMFLIALFLIIPLYKKPKIGLLLTAILFVLSSTLNGILNYTRNLPPVVIYNTPLESVVKQQISSIHTPTYNHLSSYCVGIIVGYILYKKQNYHINKYLSSFMSSLSIIGLIFILLIPYTWMFTAPWNPYFSAIYAALHRPLWSTLIAWIIFACETDNAVGPLRSILKWKIFHPLSKLSYSVYLLHFLIIWTRYAYLRTPLTFSNYAMFGEFLINACLSVVASIIVYIGFELPLIRLTKLHLPDIKLFDIKLNDNVYDLEKLKNCNPT